MTRAIILALLLAACASDDRLNLPTADCGPRDIEFTAEQLSCLKAAAVPVDVGPVEDYQGAWWR